jgi:cholesterol oxidase
MRASYDVVVIGSGFGGAITAHRLAEAGRSVAILEQGRRWAPQDFPRSVRQVGGGFWSDSISSGFLEYRAFPKIDVIQGVGVGGGSLHYFNVGARAPARIFSAWPKPYSRALLDPYYDAVQEKLDSRPFTPPTGRQLPPRTTAFLEAARRCGHEGQLVPIAVYSGAERKNRAGVAQSPCNYCGDCMLGCNVQAKNTLDINYIAEAEREHGAEVFPSHRATHVEPLDGQGYAVHFRAVVAAGETGEPGRVIGKRVIVAAGALGSTELLLRSRDQHRTLAKLGDQLGRRFSGNGDMLLGGAMDVPTETPVDPAVGPSITAIADFSTDEHSIHIEDLGYPDQMLWFLEAVLPPRKGRVRQILELAGRYLKRTLGLGSVGSRVSDEIGELLAGGRTAHFLPFLGMGSDAADGRMSLRNGQLDIAWRHARSRAMFREMERGMDRLATSIGGRYARSFLWRWPTRKLLTAHPLGGCAMSERPEDGVVNHAGEVWGYPGLYVADGAVLPSALSVNPSLTIGAVAERVSRWIVSGSELGA